MIKEQAQFNTHIQKKNNLTHVSTIYVYSKHHRLKYKTWKYKTFTRKHRKYSWPRPRFLKLTVKAWSFREKKINKLDVLKTQKLCSYKTLIRMKKNEKKNEKNRLGENSCKENIYNI